MKFFALPLLAVVAAAAPLVSRGNGTTCDTCHRPKEPCAIISDTVKQFYAIASNAQLPCPVDPEIAFSCLVSSTIDEELAFDYVMELKKYTEFQSTLAYLKEPPLDYPYPPVDLQAGMDRIAFKIATGVFSSQYVLDQTIKALYASAHEGHLRGGFCTSDTGISFGRPVDFVSVSFDGVAVPHLYIYGDIASGSPAISRVVKINGQDPVDFLQEEALSAAAGLDPDASYNAVLHNFGRFPAATFAEGLFAFPVTYPGPWTNVTFSNDTIAHYRTVASVAPGAWSTDIIDGASLTYTYCISPAQPSSVEPSPTASPTSSPTSSSTATATPSKLPSLYPYTPVVVDPYNQLAGYFLNGTGYEDTAVLWVGIFEQESANFYRATKSFQNVTRDFFAAMRQANKKRIIIDLSGNPGGNAMMPEDLFHNFFPSIEPYNGARARVGEAADIWGQTIAAIPDEVIQPTAAEKAADPRLMPLYKAVLQTCVYNWRAALSATLKPFTGWLGSFFPPNIKHLDSFTANFRWSLQNAFFTELYDALEIYGYPANPALYLRPFQPENIIIVTDGFCSSACSIFAELMTRQGGVKTIALGGRPKKHPMQAIGGTKGSSAFSFAQLQKISLTLIPDFADYIPPHLLSLANDTFPGLVPLPLGSPDSLSRYGVNLLDTIPVDSDAGVPLQFVFEPADCHAFYTPDMVREQRSVWEYAWNLTWGEQECAWAKDDWRV